MIKKITVIIPTKNRPEDLLNAISSICHQTRLPDELLIVDQSSQEQNNLISNFFLECSSKIHLVYIHDVNIVGLVDAKRVAVTRASGDLLFFLEDDVVLESEYIEKIINGFDINPTMVGSCGVITNPPKTGRLYCYLFHLFHRGIFIDNRVGVNIASAKNMYQLIPSMMLSGGVSAWRREVFQWVHLM